MDKISIFYQEITNLNEIIDSLVEEDKSIKNKFMSNIDWENEFQYSGIPKVSKRDKRLMPTSLTCREKEEK